MAVFALLWLVVDAARAQPRPAAIPSPMGVRKLAPAGPWEIIEGDRPVLRYNYQIVPLPDAVKPRIAPGNRKYAVPRSDYIHPLYGLHGEILTDDWVADHPHHRGIYWAWPEVDWQGKRGDLHALQEVFARPTGKIEFSQGADFAQIQAENEWHFGDGPAIVREIAILRAWRQTDVGRAIDLDLRFAALSTDVQVARRGQSHYGGLNIRLSPVVDQKIVTSTGPPAATFPMAWAQRSGTPPAGGYAASGSPGGPWPTALTILQSPGNPDYPGDWVQYPEISWIQPTFPASGTRYTLRKDRPLVLRYRLWIHGKPLAAEAIRNLVTAPSSLPPGALP
jgi:hypothetical protein